MKRKLSLISKAIVCVAISAFALLPNLAYADYNDTSWNFFTTTGGSGYVSSWRFKEDASSTYIYCNGAVRSGVTITDAYFLAIPHGSTSPSATFSNMQYTKNGITYSAAEQKVYYGQQKKLPNYIYEAGGRFVKIHYNTTFGRVTFSGAWSPDSI
jgi:hypothetical protein